MWWNNIVAFALCYHRNKNSWKVDLFSFRIWWSHFGGCRSKGAGIVYFWCNRHVSSLCLKVISNKKKQLLFYMPRLCLTRWIGWKLFCGQLYWWSRWLILTSFTQVSDKLPSNVAIKKNMFNGGDFHMLPAIFDSPVNKHLVVPSNVLLTISLGNKTINVWDLQWI